jgi:hypothetical protein
MFLISVALTGFAPRGGYATVSSLMFQGRCGRCGQPAHTSPNLSPTSAPHAHTASLYFCALRHSTISVHLPAVPALCSALHPRRLVAPPNLSLCAASAQTFCDPG